MIARLLDFPAGFYLTNKLEDGDAPVYLQVPLPTTPDAPYVVGVLPRFAPHFPYGYRVEPDDLL
jgi:hypothetical protein